MPNVRAPIWKARSMALAPEDFPYVHTLEGPDDMPAHVKASLMGSSVTIPVADGQFTAGHLAGHRFVRTPQSRRAPIDRVKHCGGATSNR